MTMNEFKPSKYQQAVYDFIENGSGHAIIEAVAGSGKTTTIVNSLKLISPDKDIIFCAFNNSIVAELKKRTPFYVDVTTMHSLGWRAMLAYYNGCKLNPSKVFKIAERVLWRVPKRERGYYFMILQKLIDLYRQNLIESEEAFVELAEKHSLDVYNGEIEDAMKIFIMMLEDNSEFDFTDMIYIPAILDEIRLKKYDYVFVDECQDLNIAQQKIIKKIMKPTARLISVGDSRQCQPKGTKVRLANGEDKNIEDIEVGDMVVSFYDNDFIGWKSKNKQSKGVRVNKISKSLLS